MRKIILRQQLLTISLYIFVYLCRSFIVFEFKNPFQWIIDIPKYDEETRLFIIFFGTIYYVASFIIINDHYKSKSK